MGKTIFVRACLTGGLKKEFALLILFESLILAQDERWRRG
jgi:hypothetical protein